MTRRSAVTLMEVLITMFIMTIGMLALLVLFPVGAVSMAKALKDDRCASAASMAEQHAIAMNVRQDPVVTASLNAAAPLPNVPSNPVYVDPYGFTTLRATPLASASVSFPRATVSYAGTQQLVDRWFSLPNDINFTEFGTPDLTGAFVERGREYTWAYLLQRPQAWSPEAVNLTVVVYRKRPVGVLTPEVTYPAAGAQGAGSLTISWTGLPAPTLKRGVWLLDTTPVVGTIPAARFYRVVNVSDSGTLVSASLDVQPNLANTVTQVAVMDYVAEVFDKGTSWQP
jgi:Tfp pilus assembly protein PilV